MLITILIIISALYWLGIESKWLTIRLPADETLKEFDRRILAEIKAEYDAKEADYNKWLEARYAPKLVMCYQQDKEVINPRDEWMAAVESQDKRRNGEMIYQRGSRG